MSASKNKIRFTAHKKCGLSMYSEVSANTRDYTKKVRTQIEVRVFRHSESLLKFADFQNTVAENNMFFPNIFNIGKISLSNDFFPNDKSSKKVRITSQLSKKATEIFTGQKPLQKFADFQNLTGKTIPPSTSPQEARGLYSNNFGFSPHLLATGSPSVQKSTRSQMAPTIGINAMKYIQPDFPTSCSLLTHTERDGTKTARA